MTATKIERNGECVAILIATPDGRRYVVEPVVFDQDGKLVMGHDVLHAVVQSGKTIELPVLRGLSPGDVADLEQFLERVREQLDAKDDGGYPELDDYR
jgi:hypothetical protein